MSYHTEAFTHIKIHVCTHIPIYLHTHTHPDFFLALVIILVHSAALQISPNCFFYKVIRKYEYLKSPFKYRSLKCKPKYSRLTVLSWGSSIEVQLYSRWLSHRIKGPVTHYLVMFNPWYLRKEGSTFKNSRMDDLNFKSSSSPSVSLLYLVYKIGKIICILLGCWKDWDNICEEWERKHQGSSLNSL